MNVNQPDIIKIPARVIKRSKNALVSPITALINMSFEQWIFFRLSKMAELAPVFKKYGKMNNNNFSPVSVYCNQMMTFLMKFCPNF